MIHDLCGHTRDALFLALAGVSAPAAAGVPTGQQRPAACERIV